MAKARFLDKLQPFRPRFRDVRWPLPCGGEPPRVRVRVLGGDELEAAHLATLDHFGKRKLPTDSEAFVARERYEIIWRGLREVETGEPIAASTEDLVETFTAQERDVLFAEWRSLQVDVAVAPPSSADLEQLVDALKKNSLAGLLDGFSSTWLIELCTTLVAQLHNSTRGSSPG